MATLPILQPPGFGTTAAFALSLGVVVAASLGLVTYWTDRDATRRDVDKPRLWMAVVLLGNLLGLAVYLRVRE